MLFQSTCPMRGMTMEMKNKEFFKEISIHMPHAGHDSMKSKPGAADRISIHMPHAGHDLRRSSATEQMWNFNPHAPCGAWHRFWTVDVRFRQFQSTCPMRGMTLRKFKKDVCGIFQSTCPMRGMTGENSTVCSPVSISIHMPHAGHDVNGILSKVRDANFNPHAPCGAWQQTVTKTVRKTLSQLSKMPIGILLFTHKKVFHKKITKKISNNPVRTSPDFHVHIRSAFTILTAHQLVFLVLLRNVLFWSCDDFQVNRTEHCLFQDLFLLKSGV